MQDLTLDKFSKEPIKSNNLEHNREHQLLQNTQTENINTSINTENNNQKEKNKESYISINFPIPVFLLIRVYENILDYVNNKSEFKVSLQF